jgi:hypothetical protein
MDVPVQLDDVQGGTTKTFLMELPLSSMVPVTVVPLLYVSPFISIKLKLVWSKNKLSYIFKTGLVVE